MVRSPCCEKVGLKRGRWAAEEDAILIKYIQQNGEGSWKSLPKNAGLLRCGKSCRLRWINYLRSDLKRGNFTTEEEEIIIEFHRSLGNRWSLIASHLPGRTDNEVKNYWNSHLSRKLYSFTSNKTNGSILKTTAIDLINMANTTKRQGGRVSRSIAKKYNKNNTHSRISVLKTKDIVSIATQNACKTDELQEHLSRADNAMKKDRGDVAGLMEEDSMGKHVIYDRAELNACKTVVNSEELQNLSRAENTMKEDKVDVAGLMEEDSMEKHVINDEAELWGCQFTSGQDRLPSSISTSPKDLDTFDNQDDCFLTTLLDQDWNLALNDTGSWDPNTKVENLDKSFSPLSFQLKNEELINNEWDFNSVAYGNGVWDVDNDNWLWI